MPHFYNPNQARVPAGRHGGGQWTREGGGPDAIVRPAFLQSLVAPAVRVAEPRISSLLALFAGLSARNNRDQRAVITFKAGLFPGDKEGKLELEGVRLLDREEVEDNCKKLKDVQMWTDTAYTRALARGLKQPQLGTAVHEEVEIKINGRDKQPKNRNFMAELSFLKMEDEVPGSTAGLPPVRVVTRGTIDSIRVDAYEKTKNGTVCVYDIKTGRSGLSWPRMVEIAEHVVENYGPNARVIVTEVRPMLRTMQ